MVKFLFEMEEFLLLALSHLLDGNAGPTGYNLSNILGVDFLLDHGGSTLHRLQFLLDFPDLLA